MSSVDLAPIVDVFVSQANPTTNYASYLYGVIGDITGTTAAIYDGSPGPPPSGICRNWYMFDLSGIPGAATINSALLYIGGMGDSNLGGYGGVVNVDIARCTDISWTNAINWNTAPNASVGSVLATTDIAGSGDDQQFTITSAVAAALASGKIALRTKAQDEVNAAAGPFGSQTWSRRYTGGDFPPATNPTLTVNYTSGGAGHPYLINFMSGQN